MLEKKIFTKNRKKLFEKIANDSFAIIHAKDLHIKGDSTYFSQSDPNLFYFSGITQEQSILLICKTNNKLQTKLFIIRPNSKKEMWEGKKLSKQEAKNISGIQKTYYLDEFESIISEQLKTHKKIYLPENPHEIGKTEVTLYFDSLKEKFPSHSFLPLNPYLKELRQTKEKEEIKEIKKAIGITKKGFLEVLKSISNFKNETEIEGKLTQVFTSNFACHAYHPIVAQNENALILHYISNNSPLKKNKLLLIDAGAQYNQYHSDISRTFPISGKFTPQQKKVYSAVLHIQEYAISLLKPGVNRRKYEINIIKKTATELIKIKCIPEAKTQQLLENLSKQEITTDDYKKNLKELVELVKPFYPHSTSHFLGLDTHDLGDYSSEILEGEVLTVEPGIYIKKKNIGIRIEDNVLITKNGCKVLSKEIPKSIEDIEKIANSKE